MADMSACCANPDALPLNDELFSPPDEDDESVQQVSVCSSILPVLRAHQSSILCTEACVWPPGG